MRQLKDTLFQGIVFLISFSAVIPLTLILYYIISRGFSSLSIEFITELPRPMGETGGGIVNAIVGSLMLACIAGVIAIPSGVAAGIFLAEFSENTLSRILRFCIDILQGIPSIVVGIAVYAWIVVPSGSFSALSGSIALAILMFPVIVRSTEETVRLIPHSLREAALALGVPWYSTILKIILPASASGIITGILLSIARILGETAPLLFTAFGNPYMNWNPIKPIDSLPMVIFNYATGPYPEYHELAWTASLILLIIILIMNLAAKAGARKWKIKF